MDEDSSTPPSSSFSPSQGLAADGQEARDGAWERPGTLPAAHRELPSSCHQHPTPGRRPRGQTGEGERQRAGVISPLRPPARLLTAFVSPDVQLLRQLGDHQEGPPALALLGFEDVPKDVVSDVQDILPFGPQQVTDCV